MSNNELSPNKTAAYNIISVILIQGISFITAPVFSRLLGTDNFGIYSAFNAWQGILVIVLPLSVAATIPMAVNEFNKSEQHTYQSSILTLGITSTVLWSALIFLGGFAIPNLFGLDQPMRILLLLSVLFNFIVNFANSRYTFELQANKNFILAIASSLLTVGISLGFVIAMPKETNYMGRIYGGIVANGILALITGILIFRDGKIQIKKEYASFCLPLCIPVVFHALSNVILNQSDRIMLQDMSNNSIVGIYTLAYSFTGILTAIYSAMNNSWIPYYFRYLGSNNLAELKEHAKNYIYLYTLITIGFLLVFKEVYSVFADKMYWDGVSIIPILVIGLYFMYIYSFAINYEFYLKKTKGMAVITMTAASLNLILNWFLIRKYNMIGAAVATTISYFYEYIIHYVYVKKISKGEFPFDIWFYAKPCCLAIIGLLVFYCFETHFFIRWAIAGLVGLYIAVTMYKRRAIF